MDIYSKLPNDVKFKVNGKTLVIKGKKLSKLVDFDGEALEKFQKTVVSDADWTALNKAYGKMGCFKEGLIFAQKQNKSAKDQAKDHEKQKSGFEQIDPKEVKTEPEKA